MSQGITLLVNDILARLANRKQAIVDLKIMGNLKSDTRLRDKLLESVSRVTLFSS